MWVCVHIAGALRDDDSAAPAHHDSAAPAQPSVTATPPPATGNLEPSVAADSNAAQPEMYEEEADLCASIFRGLVFYLAREVPQEALLLVIRAFGGTAGWQGEGSPISEDDESITHQARAPQKHL